MTKREAERQTHQADTLRALGFTHEEADKLRLISIRLHRWYELECGNGYGCIERDGENGDGKPFWLNSRTMHRSPMRDMERGAIKRLKAIIKARNERGMVPEGARTDPSGKFPLSYYLQGDPRGAVLYIIRPGDVPDGADVNSYYTRGICVY